MIRRNPYALILIAALLAGGAAKEENPSRLEIDTPPASVWRIQESLTDASLRGVSAVSRNIVWASGTQGTFLRTTDGGLHWTKGQVPGAESLDFRDIQAFDGARACLLSAGRPAKIYKTVNGGRTWRETYHNDAEGVFFDAFAFFNEGHGIAVGDPMEGRFMLITTEDGGETWKEVPAQNRPQALEGESAFAASGTCLAVLGRKEAWFCTGGPSPRIIFSKNSGRTWEAVASPLALGTPSSGGFSLAFFDHENGILVGGDYKDEAGTVKTAAMSRDGGRTWSTVEQNGPSGFRECVAIVSHAKRGLAIAVGPTGSDISSDMGRSWTPLPGPGFHSLSFSHKDGTGWAVGKDGLIAQIDLDAARALLSRSAQNHR